MIPEKVFQQILALGETWRVARMDYQEKEQRVLIRVEETPALWKQESCPHCGHKTVRGYDHAPARHWRHLNICQLQSEIVCALPRGECQDCRKIYTVRAPWEGRSRGLTQEFEAFALTTVEQARNRFESWSRWVRAEAEALTSGLLEPMRKAAAWWRDISKAFWPTGGKG